MRVVLPLPQSCSRWVYLLHGCMGGGGMRTCHGGCGRRGLQGGIGLLLWDAEGVEFGCVAVVLVETE